MIPIGSLLGGLLGSTIGIWQTLAVGAIGMSLALEAAQPNQLGKITRPDEPGPDCSHNGRRHR